MKRNPGSQLSRLDPWNHRSPSFPELWDRVSCVEDTFKRVEREIQQVQNRVEMMLRNCENDSGVERITLDLNPEVRLENDGDTGRLVLDMGRDFPQENIQISLRGRQLEIRAALERVSPRHGSKTYEEVRRTITIPEAMNVEHLKSFWRGNGLLSVEAPLQQPPMIQQKNEMPSLL